MCCNQKINCEICIKQNVRICWGIVPSSRKILFQKQFTGLSVALMVYVRDSSMQIAAAYTSAVSSCSSLLYTHLCWANEMLHAKTRFLIQKYAYEGLRYFISIKDQYRPIMYLLRLKQGRCVSHGRVPLDCYCRCCSLCCSIARLQALAR